MALEAVALDVKATKATVTDTKATIDKLAESQQTLVENQLELNRMFKQLMGKLGG